MQVDTKNQTNYVTSYGELLWDVLPDGEVLGGAPANFAYRLGTLGIPIYLVSKIGNDERGHKAVEILESLGINTNLVQKDETLPTGNVEVKISDNGNASYTIHRNVAYDAITVTPELRDVMISSKLICFGTLIQRAGGSRNTLYELLDQAKDSKKLLDINLRKDCFDEETIRKSLQYADILKLNQDEVKVVNNLLQLGISDDREFCKKMFEEFNIECCLITRAEKGVYAEDKNGNCVDLPGYSVKVVDTIGSGDAFTAGFVSRYMKGESLEDCCAFGNKLGAEVAKVKGGISPVEITF